jgi:hypothetical protein
MKRQLNTCSASVGHRSRNNLRLPQGSPSVSIWMLPPMSPPTRLSAPKSKQAIAVAGLVVAGLVVAGLVVAGLVVAGLEALAGPGVASYLQVAVAQVGFPAHRGQHLPPAATTP